MIYRLVAYSLVLLGMGGTIYMAIEGVYRDEYDVPGIAYEELIRQLADSSELTIIDVRNADEISDRDSLWEEVLHIPLFLLEKRSIELTPYRDSPLILVCPNGKRSMQGAQILRLAGFEAYYLDKGLAATKREKNG